MVTIITIIMLPHNAFVVIFLTIIRIGFNIFMVVFATIKQVSHTYKIGVPHL